MIHEGNLTQRRGRRSFRWFMADSCFCSNDQCLVFVYPKLKLCSILDFFFFLKNDMAELSASSQVDLQY